MEGSLHLGHRKGTFEIKMSKQRNMTCWGQGDMVGTARQTEYKIFRNKIKLEVFLKSSTTHHHPDKFFIIDAAVGVFVPC